MLRLTISTVIAFSVVRAVAAEPATPADPPPTSQPSPTQANLSYGDHPRQVLDFYKAASDKPTPVVIYMHGGSWLRGDKADIAKTHFEKYLAAGISVVSFNYRFVPQAKAQGLKPPVQGPMHDAARVVQLVRSKAGEWNIDKQHVAVSGASAGACTSLWIALHDELADPKSSDPIARESTRVTCAAVNIAQTSLDPQQMKEWIPNTFYGGHAFGFNAAKAGDGHFAEFLVHREEVLPWIKEYSPYELASAGDPPVYLIYKNPPAMGEPQKDPTHSANFGVKLQEKLKSLGDSCELVYPGAPEVKHAEMEDFVLEALKK